MVPECKEAAADENREKESIPCNKDAVWMPILDTEQEDRERRAKRKDNAMLPFYGGSQRRQDNGQRTEGYQQRNEIHCPVSAGTET
jgi:hypothetical protein